MTCFAYPISNYIRIKTQLYILVKTSRYETFRDCVIDLPLR